MRVCLHAPPKQMQFVPTVKLFPTTWVPVTKGKRKEALFKASKVKININHLFLLKCKLLPHRGVRETLPQLPYAAEHCLRKPLFFLAINVSVHDSAAVYKKQFGR